MRKGLRDGTIGLAPLAAVLSFLRTEGVSYEAVTRRAGAYAAEWTIAELSPFRRRVITRAPAVSASHSGTSHSATARAPVVYRKSRRVRVRRGVGQVDIKSSIFCGVRDRTTHPLCYFYESAFVTVLRQLDVAASAAVTACQAEGSPSCHVDLRLDGAAQPSAEDTVDLRGSTRRMTRVRARLSRTARAPARRSSVHGFSLGTTRRRSDTDRAVRRRVGPPRLVDGRGRRAAARRRSQRHGRRCDHPRRARPRARTAAGAGASHADSRHGHQDRTARGRGDGGQRPPRFRRRCARRARGGDSDRHRPGQRRLRGARPAQRAARDDRTRGPASACRPRPFRRPSSSSSIRRSRPSRIS